MAGGLGIFERRAELQRQAAWLLFVLLVFFLDCVTPLSIVVSVAYVAAMVFATLRPPSSSQTLWAASICSGLTILAVGLSSGTITNVVLIDRALVIAAVWGTALVGLQRRRQLRSREKLLAQQMAVLVQLMHQPVGQGKLEESLRKILDAAARTLEVEIVSVWQFNEAQTTLGCLARYEKSTGRLTSGLQLDARDYPAYFAAARQERSIAAHDAYRDPRTREFAANYLPQHGITSMLDAAIWLEGRLVGLVCHEHMGPARQWTPDEQNFAASIAEFVSLVLEAHERRRTEQLLRGRNLVFEKLATGADLGQVLATLVEVTEQYQPHWTVTLQLAEPARYGSESLPDLAAAPAASTHFPLSWREPICGAAHEPLGDLRVDWRDDLLPTTRDRELIRSTAQLAGIAIQRKLAERALQAAHDELEIRVARRTCELERSNQALQQFAYVASHDLQEPLRAVAGYCQLLQNRYLLQIDQEGRDFLEFAVAGAQRMQNLVNGLLEYSRVGSSHWPPARISAAEALHEAQANLHTAFNETGAHVEVGQLPEVIADRTQLVSVFQNLLANALKYRGAAAPRLQVCAKSHDGEWEFVVRDNGIGVPPQHRERIFDIFHRLHTRDEYPGAGLGLALCKKIIECHGGRIWIDSDERPGSIFHFTLPQIETTK